jgi:hypothetical protein
MPVLLRFAVAAALLGIAPVVGCERLPISPQIGTVETVETVEIALSLAGGAAIGGASWRVVSSAGVVLASGNVGPSGPGWPASFGVGLSPAVGDLVEMTATTGEGATCAGTSAPFDVIAGGVVSVSVTLLCGTLAGDAGSVVVTGSLAPGDSCPAVASWRLAPLEASSAGGPFALSVSVSETDLPDAGDRLTYSWTATSGSFTDRAVPSTEFLCGAPGTPTISLTISDSHAATPCVLELSFPPVTCP